jgi:hypothetical protein
MTQPAPSGLNVAHITTPPSLLFPLAGALVGYLVSDSIWGAAFGATAGALYNVSASAVQLEGAVASQQGIQLYDTNLSLAARSYLGKGPASPLTLTPAAQAAQADQANQTPPAQQLPQQSTQGRWIWADG